MCLVDASKAQQDGLRADARDLQPQRSAVPAKRRNFSCCRDDTVNWPLLAWCARDMQRPYANGLNLWVPVLCLNLIIKILHEMPRFFQAAFIPKLALYSQFSSFFQTLDLRVFNKTRIATRGPSQLLGHRCKNSSMLCCCSLEASESTNFSTL